MGGELLNDEASHVKTHTEIFEEQFPSYLAIGMSSAEYWEGDPSLTRYYRKAYKTKQEQEDYTAWLHGLYVYDAVSTAIYNGFIRGKNDSAKNYFERPISASKRLDKELEEKKRKEAEAQAMVWMNNLTLNYKHLGGESQHDDRPT